MAQVVGQLGRLVGTKSQSMTHLCVAIFVTDIDEARRDIALAAEAGADMVELRLDHCADQAQFNSLIQQSILPVIATLRPAWEGGQSRLPDQQRVGLLKAAADNGASYVDLESRASEHAAALKPTPPETRPRLILSHHDFGGRPDRLYNILGDLNATEADVVKIVWTARTIRDNLEAFEILRNRQKPTIALCMGEAGLISRILAKKFGAFLTFAALDSSGGTAPGQISIADMKRLYRWDAINPDTRVYGVVGSPVGHSMSPAIHNAAFDRIGHDGLYLPLLVEPGYESFKAFMETFLNFEGLHFSGCSVTIPHKENALRYLAEKGADIEPLARSIGALNTIVVRPPGAVGQLPTLRGFSTDYAAILDSITSRLNITRQQLRDYRVAVLGAGGTGRTAVAALAHYGATVVVYNRTVEKARELAREFDGKTGQVVAMPLDRLCDSCCQIYLNATSVGMHPKVDQCPWGEKPPRLSKDTLVFDTIYNPMKTKLLRQAEDAGALTISGVEMFVRQAVGQFEAWTGKPAPVDLMRQVVESRLGGKKQPQSRG